MMDRDFALIIMKDELHFRQNKIEFYNLEIERHRVLLAEQKRKIREVMTEIENLERRVANETSH